MKRRGFLGAAAAAPIAGPEAARSLLKGLSLSSNMNIEGVRELHHWSTMGHDPFSGPIAMGENAEYYLKELKEALGWLDSRKEWDETRRQVRAGFASQVMENRISALRSVRQWYRDKMLIDAIVRATIAQKRVWMNERVTWLRSRLKDFGVSD